MKTKNFKVHNLVSVHPKNIILGQMTNLSMIFHVDGSFIDLFQFETRPSFLLNFGTANSAVLKLKFPRHSRIRVVPDLHAGVFTIILVCIPTKGAVLLAESRNCRPLENIASSFSKPRLVLSDTGFP